jgi:hypothetical protein
MAELDRTVLSRGEKKRAWNRAERRLNFEKQTRQATAEDLFFRNPFVSRSKVSDRSLVRFFGAVRRSANDPEGLLELKKPKNGAGLALQQTT